MIEFKIRFRSGDLGYFRIKDLETTEEAQEAIDVIANIFLKLMIMEKSSH